MESLEAAIAVYIVRFGIVLVALALSVANWVRTSRVERQRMSLPDDLKANVSRLRHEVDSVNESLRSHVAKEESRVGRAADKLRKEEAAAAASVGDVRAGVEALSIPPQTGELTQRQIKLALNRAVSLENDKRRGRRSA